MKMRVLAWILLLLTLLSLLLSCTPRAQDVLCVTVLDVGQGDCTLLSLNGHHVLIDTGSAASREQLLGELDRLGVGDLDAIFLTHSHEDHYGNVGMLVETRTVGTLFVAYAQDAELGYRLALERAITARTNIQTIFDEDVLWIDGMEYEVYCPLPKDPEPNNAGLVLRVRYGDCRLLFTGDAELAAECALLARGVDLRCDFLKVGHHGSKTACSVEFLQASAPKIATISCAADNDYGFPHDEVLDGLEAVGTAVYRTDLAGTLRFVCDGTNIIFEE